MTKIIFIATFWAYGSLDFINQHKIMLLMVYNMPMLVKLQFSSIYVGSAEGGLALGAERRGGLGGIKNRFYELNFFWVIFFGISAWEKSMNSKFKICIF